MSRLLIPALTCCALTLLTTPGAPQAKAGPTPAAKAPPTAAAANSAGDVIARVGDQTITFSEIGTALNSSAVVGVSVPALGTPERDTARVTLLDKLVSANLMYLDALKQGLDLDPLYRRQVDQFDTAILAGLYQQEVLAGDIAVSDREVQDAFEKNFFKGTPLTPERRAAVESKLRRDKLREQLSEARARIRDGVQVVVHEERLDAAGDAARADDAVMAGIDGEPVTWGAVKGRVVSAGKGALVADPLADSGQARRHALEVEIDLRIMAARARAAGLDAHPLFRARSGEFHKNRLINMHRERLIERWEPTEQALRAFYDANRDGIVQPEARRIQMIVVATREEADALKTAIESGDKTMYEAARDHSIAANAKHDLGEVGWIYQGETVPALDHVIFALGPAEISAPVETPAGWHLVTVQDVQQARFDDLSDPRTRKLTRRRYLDQRLNDYVVGLRRNDFDVEVYEDVLLRLAQQEANMVRELAERAAQPGSITEQRVEELGRALGPQPR